MPPLHPVVVCTGLRKDEVVCHEELVKGRRPDAVHGPWLEVLQNGTRHVVAASCFVEVHIKLQIRITVFIADYLPDLGSNLVPALTALDVDKTQPTNMLLLLLLSLLLLGL